MAAEERNGKVAKWWEVDEYIMNMIVEHSMAKSPAGMSNTD